MSDPLIGSDHLVGSWDEEVQGWSLRDFTPGPAGNAGMELEGDVEIDVDYADPGTLTGLFVPSEDGRMGREAREVVAALLGRGRALEMVGLQKQPGRTRALRSRADLDELSDPRRRDYGTFRPSRGVDESLAQAVLALDLEDRVGADSLVHALVLLDAVRAAQRIEAPVLSIDVRARAAEAVERLVDADVDELLGSGLPPWQLSSALDDVQPLLQASLAEQSRRLTDELGHC